MNTQKFKYLKLRPINELLECDEKMEQGNSNSEDTRQKQDCCLLKDCICEISESFETHHQVSTTNSNNNVIPKESNDIEILKVNDEPKSISMLENKNETNSATRHKKHKKKDKKHKRQQQKTKNQKVKVIKSQNKTIFECSECGKQSEKRTRITNHYSRVHINWLRCDQCNYKCLKNHKLANHKLMH